MVLTLARFADALKYILERPKLPVPCGYSAVSPPCQSPLQGRGGLPCCSSQGVCVHLQLGHGEVDTASVSLQGQKWDLAICSGLSQWAVAAWLQGGEREMVLPQCPECDL